MAKNQEYNATSTSKEITEAQCKKEHVNSLEISRIEFERKSVDEIKELSIFQLAKCFYTNYLLIRDYEEHNQIYSDQFSSEKQKHESDVYIAQHTKPDMNKLIVTFEMLKTKVLQLPQYNQDGSSPFKSWNSNIRNHMDNLQDLTSENFESMTKETKETLQGVIADLEQLLSSLPYQNILATWEMVINKGDVTNLTEEDKLAIAANEEKLKLPPTYLSLNPDYLTGEGKVALEHYLNREDVSITGSSDLVDDDLA